MRIVSDLFVYTTSQDGVDCMNSTTMADDLNKDDQSLFKFLGLQCACASRDTAPLIAICCGHT